MADIPRTPAMRVLVIDDDPLFRSLVVSLLHKECAVAVAADGSDGFYQALEQPPDVALIDVQMPGWDGLKTLKAFRGHPALANVKTMMLTSDASKETVVAAIQAGANDYVIKTTFSRHDFQQKLQRLLPDRFAAPAEQADASVPGQPAPSATRTPQGTHVTQKRDETANSPAPATIPAGAPHALPSDESQLQELMDNWE